MLFVFWNNLNISRYTPIFCSSLHRNIFSLSVNPDALPDLKLYLLPHTPNSLSLSEDTHTDIHRDTACVAIISLIIVI